MLCPRRPKRWLSCWLIVALLFMQLAASAYSCPQMGSTPAPAAAMVDMPGCDGNMPGDMDSNQPQLCKAHCQQGSQAVAAQQALDAPATPVLWAVLDWAHAQQQLAPAWPALAGLRTAWLTSGAPPPGWPAVYLSQQVLRC